MHALKCLKHNLHETKMGICIVSGFAVKPLHGPLNVSNDYTNHQKVATTSQKSAACSYFVLELLQWMDSRVTARQEQTTASSRIGARQLHEMLPITGMDPRRLAIINQGGDGLRRVASAWLRAEDALPSQIPASCAAVRFSTLCVIGQKIHSCDEIHVWRTEIVWSIKSSADRPVRPQHEIRVGKSFPPL